MNVNIKNKDFAAVYDTASNVELINEKVLTKLKHHFFRDRRLQKRLKTVGGDATSVGRAFLKVRIGKITSYIDFQVIKSDKFDYELLIGLDAIKRFKLMQDENLNVLQRDRETYIRLEKPKNLIRFEESKLNLINKSDFVDEFIVNCCTKADDDDHDLSKSQVNQIKKIVDQYINCFASDKYDVGKIKSGEAHIRLAVDKYVAQRPYKCSAADKKEIETQVRKLLDAGLVSESTSPFASPVTMVNKKGEGRSRLCIDLRQLNKLVIPESGPMPLIEDLIEKTSGCIYFSVFDINSAFWAIPIRIEDRHKLAFVTQDGHYEFNVLPFGYRNSPIIFQRILSGIIRRKGLSKFCTNFMDDVLVFSKSFEEHMEHIERFLKAVREEGFKLKMVKCKFAKKSIRYLGHVISNDEVRPMSDGLAAIRNYPQPKNASQVRQFLGKVNFYHRFIDDCSNRMEPLHHLLRTGVEFNWTVECETAFQELKKHLCEAPILQIYDPDKLSYLYTDASGVGVSGVLKQEDENGNLRPVGYFSKKLKDTLRKKPAIYLEALAIKESILFWQYKLIGREFIVVSDHKPLQNLKLKARPDEELGELVVFLSQFSFRIIYQPGKENVEADALSRNPVLEWFENEEIIRTTNLITRKELEEDQWANRDLDKKLLRKHKVLFKVKNGKKRVILSEELGAELIRRVHHEFGHIGAKATANTIRPHYSIRKVDKLIKDYCDRCTVCIMNKSRRKKLIGLLEKLGPPTRPFEVMSLDTVGGFAGNNSPKRYLHLLVDHFTKFAWMITSRNQTANEFINLVKQVAEKYQIGTLLMDQYTGINSKRLRAYLKAKRVEFIFTPVDFASANGNVERLNQTLVNRLRCKFNDGNERKAWPGLMKECLVEYNRTVHSVTGYPPVYLLYGEEVEVCPIKLEASDLDEARRRAFENIMKNHRENKRRTDKNKIDGDFEVGEQVYVEAGSSTNRNKLARLRTGPFEIEQKASTLMYRVGAGRRKRDANMFHGNQLTRAPAPRRALGGEM